MMALPNPQDLPGRVSSLETSMEFIHQKLESQDGWMRVLHEEMNTGFTQIRQEMNDKFGKIDDKFEKIDDKFDQLRKEMAGWLKWMLGTGAIAWVTIIVAVLLKH